MAFSEHDLPEAATPAANYLPYQRIGNTLTISGQLPMQNGNVVYTGTVGDDATVEDAIKAAELCTLNILAQAKAALGSLDKIVHTVRLGGFVQCVPSFRDQPIVMNGASTLLVEALGAAGKHARVAVGTNALPLNAMVEVEAQFIVQ